MQSNLLKTSILASLFLSAASFIPAHAQIGNAHKDSRYNQVSIQVQVSDNVAHDLMRVTLYSEKQGDDPVDLTAQTTRALNTAIAVARQVPDIIVQSGSRTSQPVYGKNQREIIAWRERAQLHLESKNFAALNALTAQLTNDLRLADQQFAISKIESAAHEEKLIQDAVKAFRKRAVLVSKSLGGSGYRLVKLEIDNNARFSPLLRRQSVSAMMLSNDGMAASVNAMPQQIEAGSSELTAIASGVIEIEFNKFKWKDKDTEKSKGKDKGKKPLPRQKDEPETE